MPSTLGLRLNPINPKGLDDPHWMQHPGPIQTNKQNIPITLLTNLSFLEIPLISSSIFCLSTNLLSACLFVCLFVQALDIASSVDHPTLWDLQDLVSSLRCLAFVTHLLPMVLMVTSGLTLFQMGSTPPRNRFFK